MAWSDAARAAALAARRAHLHARKSLRKMTPYDASGHTTYFGHEAKQRKQFAQYIRQARRGAFHYQGMTKSASLKKLMTVAHASTIKRNMFKKGTYPRIYVTDGRGVALAGFLRDQRLRGIGRR